MYSTHAEIDLLGRIKSWKNVPKKFDILVVKITKTGKLKSSKPCSNCICYMRRSRLNLRNVWYSTDENTIVCESVNTIENDYISSGERRKKK
jgi:hypothetical protein